MSKRMIISSQPHRLQILCITAGILVLLLMISASWLLSEHLQPNLTSNASTTRVVHMDASWARGFNTVKSAKYASDAAVSGTIVAIAQVQRDKVGIVYTDFVFRLDKVVWDPHHKLGLSSIIVHQTGGGHKQNTV